MSPRACLNFAAINAAALAVLPSLLARWLPGGKVEGHEYVVRNPKRDDRHPGSFKINVKTGAWSDFADGAKGKAKGGDPISLYGYLNDLKQGEAARELAGGLGLKTEPTAKPNGAAGKAGNGRARAEAKTEANGDARAAKAEKVPIIPVPDDAPPLRFQHPKYGAPSGTWAYHDAKGRLIGYAARFDFTKPDGSPDKDVLPLTFCDLGGGKRGWRAKGVPAPRPLYDLHKLAARLAAGERPRVLVVEGEKTAEAAGRLFPDLLVTTTMGGAKSAPHADWSPLAGLPATVWRDADEPGLGFAAAVPPLVLAAGATEARVVDVPGDWPEGWDLADEPPPGVTTDDLRRVLDAAPPWEPPPEVEVEEQAGERQGSFVLLRQEGVLAGKRRAAGVHRLVINEDKDTGKKTETWTWVCSPLEVLALSRDADGRDWGRVLLVTDPDGVEREWTMPKSMLAGDCVAFRERLLELGLELAPGKTAREALQTYVSVWPSTRRARCVAETGWHGDVFALPDAVFGDTKGERVVFQAAHPPAYAVKGSLEGWRREVAEHAIGNSRLALALMTQFAGPLLPLLDEYGGGFHLRGGSSIGKTTALLCGASVWGLAMCSWRTTDNALEGTARAANHTGLCLDESSQADARTFGESVYTLANCVGKRRMGRDGVVREAARWLVLFVSCGETALADQLREGGKRAKAGQQVRLVEIPADPGKGHGMFEDLRRFANGGALSDHLRSAAERHQGHAGRAFVAAIVGDPKAVARAVAKVRDDLVAAWVPATADGQVRRVAQRFATVAAAGDLATELGILPWPEGEAKRAAKRCFDDWLEARGGQGPAERREGLAQVRGFLEQHGSSRFEAAWAWQDRLAEDEPKDEPDAFARTINRAGFRRLVGDGDDKRWAFYVLPETWKSEICKGLDDTAVAKAMVDAGHLEKGDGKNLTRTVRVPGHGKLRLYAISVDFFSADVGGDGA